MGDGPFGRCNSTAAARRAIGAHEGLTPFADGHRRGDAWHPTHDICEGSGYLANAQAYLAPPRWQALAPVTMPDLEEPGMAVKVFKLKANKAVQKALTACRVV